MATTSTPMKITPNEIPMTIHPDFSLLLTKTS
jgi:hypothetical protein